MPEFLADAFAGLLIGLLVSWFVIDAMVTVAERVAQ